MRGAFNLRRQVRPLLCLLAGGLALAGCERQETGEGAKNVAAQPSTPEPAPEPAVALPEPPLDREKLLLAIGRAASAFAAGADDVQAQRALAGRQFRFPIRFGCGGAPEMETGAMRWSYDAPDEALRIRAVPDVTLDDARVKAAAGPAVEAVEGFWVPRPWLLADACPRAAPAAPAAGGEPPTIAVAQFFTEEDSRVQRRSRPYETVQKRPPDAIAARGGYSLVLEGRLKALPDGRVIRCIATAPEARPTCIASAEFDRVSLLEAEAGTLVAEWGRE